jgi:2-polyprenyl-3-methyl-5-hydroxy-6-metoxy-1,4-benzoquinol methylase
MVPRYNLTREIKRFGKGGAYMGREEFSNYGIRARSGLSLTELSGRYLSQVESERKILADVMRKLDVEPSDSLLEIGCGPGQILIPLSFLVREATGVDHPKVCSVLKKRVNLKNLTLIGANFLDAAFQHKSFDKILCYSVLGTLSSAELDPFIYKALSLLKPGGRMLIGDISNGDKKSRFLDSKLGEIFEREWRERGLSASNEDELRTIVDRDRIDFTDEVVLTIVGSIRKMGLHCYLLPQPEDLPWGHSREDLLIIRPD